MNKIAQTTAVIMESAKTGNAFVQKAGKEMIVPTKNAIKNA